MIFNPRQAVANVFAWFRQQLIINIRGLVEYALFHDTQSSNMSWNIVQYRQFPIGPRGINFFWSCKNKIVSEDRRCFKDSKNIKISHKSYL